MFMNTKKNQIVSLEKDKLSFTLLGYCFSISFFIILFSLTTSSTFKDFKPKDSFPEEEISSIPPVNLEMPKPRTTSEKLVLSHSTEIVIGNPIDTSNYLEDPNNFNDVIQPIGKEPEEIVIQPVINQVYMPDELTELPAFVGGDIALDNYFDVNLKYPKMAIDDGIEGVINVIFIVEADGSITNIGIDPKSPKLGSGCEIEALKVIRKMPKWTPGKVKTKAVRVLCSIPITFSLEDTD